MGEEIREIKFRAWHKKEKEMKVVIGLELQTMEIRVGEKEWWFMNYAILMQYTGKKDRDKKEIYEGDIVKNHWYSCSGKFIGGLWVVKYGMHSIEGQDYYSNSGEGFYFDAQSGIDDDTYNIANLPSDEDKGGIEIVGNVFENPEIMEGK